MVDLASNRNEYQEYFLGVKVAGALGWQPYHLHVSIVQKSENLNLLEPSGPVQAYDGNALRIYLYTIFQHVTLNICGLQNFESNPVCGIYIFVHFS